MIDACRWFTFYVSAGLFDGKVNWDICLEICGGV